MSLKSLIATMATAALLAGPMLSAPAMAQDEQTFSALQGIEAQALSAQEMDAISGELNAIDIGNTLLAIAGRLRDGRVKDAALKLADFYLTNADAINAAFEKFGVLTPCRTCP